MNRIFVTPIILILLFMTPAGCASHSTKRYHPLLSEKFRRQMRTIAVVPTVIVPKNNFDTITKGTGAVAGAGIGALRGIGVGFEVAHIVSVPPVDIIVAAITVPIGAFVGAVAGSIGGAEKALSSDVVEKAETLVNRSVAELNVQENFAEHLIVSGSNMTNYHFSLIKGRGPSAQDRKPKYRELAGQGVDAVLEVTITDLGFKGAYGNKSDPMIMFYMKGMMRVVQPNDGTELYIGDILYEGEYHYLSSWCKDNGILLQTEIEKANSSIADQTIEKLFLRYDFYPETSWAIIRTINVVDSLQPTLRWKALPWDKEWEAGDEGFLNTVSDITYDIKLWKCEFGGYHVRSGPPVYEKQDLVASERIFESEIQRSRFNPSTGQNEPLSSVRCEERIVEYTIDISLNPATCYVWSVRAKFKLDGQPRMTKWSYAMLPGESCVWITYPRGIPYPFRTPEATKPPPN